MKPDMFNTPVTILTGLGYPTRVESVMQAYRFLLDWPGSRLDPSHSVALKACKAAIAGDIDPETARGVFAAFAEKHDLLAPEIALVVTGRKRHGSDPRIR